VTTTQAPDAAASGTGTVENGAADPAGWVRGTCAGSLPGRGRAWLHPDAMEMLDGLSAEAGPARPTGFAR
jgi:hypothetical protein